jgi:DNA-binding SARP family transcriptional activator/tetratricopeptide (TPR) repeat protein
VQVLHARLLGELEVTVDGRCVETPPSRRAWALLGWLALHPGEHPRGSLAARFWPDVLDSSARASLRSALWALRRALGPAADGHLLAERDRVGLRCQTDLAAFAERLSAGDLEGAVELCQGPLLADFEDDWVLEARDEHDESLDAALARLAAGAPTPQAAVAWTRRRVALDLLNEAAARELMRLLADCGDRPGALAAYDRLCDRLRNSLGLAPAPQTRELAAAVRAADAPPDSPSAGAPPPSRASTTVGRESELGELRSTWSRVLPGAGAVVLLSGEGGIGKTRLAGELLAHAREDGARTATCASLDLGGTVPFGLWAELLRELASELKPPPADVTWPEDLAPLAPSLPRRLGRASAGDDRALAPELARARLFEAAVDLIEHATQDRPLALLFEDVHLADAPSLELLAYAARRIAQRPVLLMLTRRLAPRNAAVDALAHAVRGRGVAVRELELGPLGRRDIELLIGSVAAIDAVLREGVVAAADGNPLLALESAAAAATGAPGPPPTLRAAVRTALSGLSPAARQVSEVAAVAGRDLERAELAGVGDPASVVEAMDSGLFHSADGRFGYRHALLREAVYSELDDVGRGALHELLGATLARAAEAARHLRLAGRDDLALGRLRQAAADAITVTAFAEAAEFLREALALAPEDGGLRLELGEVCAWLGLRAQAQEQLALALEQLEPGEHALAQLRAARWFRGALCSPAQVGEAARSGLQALASAPQPLDPEVEGELLALLAWAQLTGAGSDGARETLAAFDALALDTADRPLLHHDALSARAFLLLTRGELEESCAVMVASAEAALRAARPDMAYGSWMNAASIAAARGELDEALDLADRGLASVRGFPGLEVHTQAARALLLARLGRGDAARTAAAVATELAEQVGTAELAATAALEGGLVALELGDLERGQALLAEALAYDARVPRAETRLRRAEALGRLGRAEDADKEIRAAALEPVHAADRPALLVARMSQAQGFSALARGDRELAVRRLEEAAGNWRRLVAAADVGREYMAMFVDLGRPPVAGLAEPERELAAVEAQLRELAAPQT